jgi:pimeloyl-ACP methyl ester carboxylesterase
VPVPSGLYDAALMSEALLPARRVFYLHGFASSPQSTKAAFFAERLWARGVAVSCPDLNQPDFASLTMTRMLDQLAREIEAAGDAPVTLIGSSLGGTLAILAAARLPKWIDRVVLLAPAVMFAKPGHHLLPPERIETWRREGATPFFHYAYSEERPLNFAFYQDTLQYDAFTAAFTQPMLVFQGLNDASVDCRTVEQFARDHPSVTLSLLDDDHQLIASLPRIWNDVEAFLGLVP